MEDNVNKENTPPVCVLLPKCVESEFDGFYNILRMVLLRSKSDLNHLDNALKIGMTGDAITIEPDDIVNDWRAQQTKPKQILQWKLLGFWANQNSPSLGKKLFNRSWKSPQRKCVEVIGGRSMTPDEIDVIIASKIKLQVYELSVEQSTLRKLKDFVKVPADVDVYNGEKISNKVRSYDIKAEHLNRCYDALRFEKCDDSINRNVEQPMEFSALVPSTSLTTSPASKSLTTSPASKSLTTSPASKSLTTSPASTSSRPKFDDGLPALSTHSSMFSRQHLDAHSENHVRSVKRARVDPKISETFIDSGCEREVNKRSERRSVSACIEITRPERFWMNYRKRSTICPKWLDPNEAGRDGGNGSERLHVMVFKQKDDEIRQIKLTIDELKMENENLKKEKSSFEAQFETNTALIYTLKKGVDATSELSSETEHKLAASLMTINDQERSIAQYRNTTETLESELRSSKDETAIKVREVEQLNKKTELLIDQNTKLEGQLSATNGKITEMVPELQRQISENEKIKANLHEWKKIAATKEQEVERLNKETELLIDQNKKLEGQLDALNQKVMEMVPELERRIEDSERNFIEATAENKNLKANLDEWKNIAATKERQVEQLNKTTELIIYRNTKLEEQLSAMNGKVTEMEPELERRIDENGKLEANLHEWKNIAATKEQEIVQLKKKTRQDGIIRAQKVIYDGYVAFEKNIFFHYSENIPDLEKLPIHKTALKKLNKDLGFEFE